MAYMFMDSGKGDLRARRTRTHLKEAFIEVLGKEDKSRIRMPNVTEITEVAEVNRKTFYSYYVDINALTDDIADDMVRTLSAEFTGNMEDDICALYRIMSVDDQGVRTLFESQMFAAFQRRLYGQVFALGAFGKYSDQTKYPNYVGGYFDSVIGIYHAYFHDKSDLSDIGTAAHKASGIVLSGLIGGGTH